MKMWPVSTLQRDPRMPPDFNAEFFYLYATMQLSLPCIHACSQVMATSPGIEAPNLVMIESVDGPIRRAFSAMPTQSEWENLERACGHCLEDGRTFILVDALH